jgi:hypothetical protein
MWVGYKAENEEMNSSVNVIYYGLFHLWSECILRPIKTEDLFHIFGSTSM